MGTTGPPTGTVNFYNGTTLLNPTPVALSAGTASYVVPAASLTVGTTYTIAVDYSGDTNFLASTTSSTTPVIVGGLDFTLTPNTPTSQTVNAGTMATYQVVVAPLYLNTYPGTVSFAATGQPTGSTVTFNPSTVAADGGQQTITVTVQTAAGTAQEVAPSIGSKFAPLAFALFLLPLLGARRMRRQGRRLNRLAILLLLLGSTLVGAMMTGCGGGTIKSVAQDFTLTVTATSGNVQHTAPVTLVVQ